jgi:hypothetical protein
VKPKGILRDTTPESTKGRYGKQQKKKVTLLEDSVPETPKPKGRKAKPSKRTPRAIKSQAKLEEIANEVETYKERLLKELNEGLILNPEYPAHSEQKVDKLIKKLAKGLDRNVNVGTFSVIDPFLQLCRNIITQDRSDIRDLWEKCKQYLFQEFDRFDNTEVANRLKDRLTGCNSREEGSNADANKSHNLLDYCVEHKFYGVPKSKLEEIGLGEEEIQTDEFYCNELMFEDDDHNGLERFMRKYREDYSETLNTLVDIIELIPKAHSKASHEKKLETLKDNLKQLDIKRIENEYKLRSFKNKSPLVEDSREYFEFPKKSKLKKRDFLVKSIREADLIDLHYLSNIIEEEKKHLSEEAKKNVQLKKFVTISSHIVPLLPVYKSLAESMQEEFRQYTKTAPSEDLGRFVQELKELKSHITLPQRKTRKDMHIHILNRIKTNKDYYRSDYFIGNPRNPFELLDNMDYDLQSDDPENDVEVSDVGSDPKTPRKGSVRRLTNRDSMPPNEESKFYAGFTKEYNQRFNPINLSRGPQVHIYRKNQIPSKELEYTRIRPFRKSEKIKFHCVNPLPRISDKVMAHLKPI